jgi:chitinase
LISRAHTAGAEIWPSIGGWSLSNNFPKVAANSAARTNFANDCVNLISDYDFDGIDIDWEYPTFAEHSGTPADTENFNLLLSEIRSKLDNYSLSTGKVYGLSAALSCDPDQISNYDVPYLNNVLSEFNLMTYDFHGSWDPVTGEVPVPVQSSQSTLLTFLLLYAAFRRQCPSVPARLGTRRLRCG